MTARPAPLRYRFAMWAYQRALAVAEPLIWRYFRKRGRGDTAYLDHWDERRAEGESFFADIWIHAVSLGEYRSAEPTIRTLVAAGYRIVITHATPAGRRASLAALSKEIAARRVAIRYAPIDREIYWSLFFARHLPRLGLVFEMEFWPGMIEAAAAGEVPLWLVNSQIPEKSFSRARRLRSLTGGHPAARAARVFAKSERMAERFRALGAEDVEVMGETRFDIPPPPHHVAAGKALGGSLAARSAYTFASVVAGEEEVYLAAARALSRSLVIWVPRAPELFDATDAMLRNAGLRVARRSAVLGDDLGPPPDLSRVDVLLGDSFGEMFFYLAAADVVSVGGGFVEKGAHNVIEPLALGKPVVTGPHVWTIEFPGVEAAEAGVLDICKAPGDLAGALTALQGEGVEKARAFHARHSGASARLVAAVADALGGPR